MQKLMAKSLMAVSLLASNLSYGNCVVEQRNIDSLKIQLKTIEKQLTWAEANRASTTVAGLSSAVWLAMGLKSSIINKDLNIKNSAIIGSLAVSTGLSAYNVYLSSQEVSFYKELVQNVNRNLHQKEAEIRLSVCSNIQVERSKSEKAKELYENIVVINEALRKDIDNLQAQLGNVGEKGSAIVTVGSSILLIGGAIIFKANNNMGGIIGIFAGAAGWALNAGTQTVNTVSLKMSSKEARELLTIVTQNQNKLLEQEEALRAIVNPR